MHDCSYENNWNERQMIKRIHYAVMNNVNTCIITGTGEPLQNTSFLNKLSMLFRRMDNPFPNIEFQTTGVFLSDTKREFDDFTETISDPPIHHNVNLLHGLGVNTISLSVANIFDDGLNNKIIGVPEKLQFYLHNLIQLLKENGFNVRLSLNMLKEYDDYSPEVIIMRCKALGADQVTFRKMYSSNDESEESIWVKENKCSRHTLEHLKKHIEGGLEGILPNVAVEAQGKGKLLYNLPFGPSVYSVMGMGVVIDDDCMSEKTDQALKYIILRENGKLYCRWNDEGSLIF
jgi:hypothetical protein